MLEGKAYPLEVKAVDTDESTFEGFSAAIGNLDASNDRIMPGAFKTTIRERVKAGKVKFVDHHGFGSGGPPPRTTRDLWGKVIEAEERVYD